MVEMRWVVNSEFVKVLQYRYKPHNDRRVSEIWSEWIDVPTVTEEKSNAD